MENEFDLTCFRNIVLPSENELMSSWLGDIEKPEVSFVCTTYNHGEFIEDTIKGCLLQQTDFPFEMLIHDDASTDNTCDVINYYSLRYPNIIKATMQAENQYSKDRHYPLHSMFEKAKGKYIAICEGDDFWICREKISNQVKIFEENKNVNLAYSKAFIYSVDKGEVFDCTTGKKLSDDELYTRNLIPTLTVMFKKKVLNGFYDYVGCAQDDWLQSDYQLWLWFSLKGERYFENKVTSVYRVLESSASRPKQLTAQYAFRLSALSVSSFYSEKSNTLSEQKKINFMNHVLVFLWCLKRGMNSSYEHKRIALVNSNTVMRAIIGMIFNPLVVGFIILIISNKKKDSD